MATIVGITRVETKPIEEIKPIEVVEEAVVEETTKEAPKKGDKKNKKLDDEE